MPRMRNRKATRRAFNKFSRGRGSRRALHRYFRAHR